MPSTLNVSSIHPLPGYVLVEPAKGQKKTMSGIYLPDSSDEKPQHGMVLAVGEAVVIDGQKVAPPVKVKDQVIYKKWGGNEVKIGDVEYQFLKFEDLMAMVK